MTNYLPNWLSLKIGQTLKKVNEGQLLSMICIIVLNLYCLWFMGNGKGHVCSFIIEVSSRDWASVQSMSTGLATSPVDQNPTSDRESWGTWPDTKLGDGKLLLWVCRKCKEREEKDKMKIHPLKMDPDETKPPCSGQYHQGHLPTSWIIFIPDCPGPMVIQNIRQIILLSVLVFNFCQSLCMQLWAYAQNFFAHSWVHTACAQIVFVRTLEAISREEGSSGWDGPCNPVIFNLAFCHLFLSHSHLPSLFQCNIAICAQSDLIH